MLSASPPRAPNPPSKTPCDARIATLYTSRMASVEMSKVKKRANQAKVAGAALVATSALGASATLSSLVSVMQNTFQRYKYDRFVADLI